MRLRHGAVFLLLVTMVPGCRIAFLEREPQEPPVMYELCNRCGAARVWGEGYVAEMPSGCSDRKCAFLPSSKEELIQKGYKVRAQWKLYRDGKQRTDKRLLTPADTPPSPAE